MSKRILGAIALGALLLTGCANSGTGMAPPKTVDSVDLERYQGTWYEIARLPMFFQRNCVESEAHYQLQDDGSVAVTNRCREADGQWNQVEGRAVPQVEGKTDKLWVTFDNWFSRLLPGVTKGEYWVLDLDDDYQTALVGHPNHKYLWLLSRTPTISNEVRDELLSVARAQGYDTSELIWRDGAKPAQ
ncbi:apolipoprotein D and lipocalin family protein [Pseudomonas sp. AG1028]|uniref:lipocalin family protein n=1 Tax=Pseudomonas sp. AG1028 TaxID=2572911 RepID=UPI0011ACE2F4|nr:lipocalin family protein [Pseudomonas sp. AG1028]TWE07820.1 apolipoprotein D and lipocalin family protein [Pseudomonas sp. AG1028]